MVANYFWDMELAKALTPALHAVEIALRNSIHEHLSRHFDTEMWFYLPGVLEPGQLSQLSAALRELSKRRASPTAGRIVAELTFGFWATLLSSSYEQRLWQPDGFALLRQVFPNATGMSMQLVQRHYNALRSLRNRVSHYEAIWDRKNLAQDYRNVLQGIEWVSIPLRTAVETMSDFLVVYDDGEGYQAVLKRLSTGVSI
jgi:hypothetical protein